MPPTLQRKLLMHVVPVLLVVLAYEVALGAASMKSVRIEEIPFGQSEPKELKTAHKDSGIHAITQFEAQRSFFHLFHVPYIVCFYAAKGKWPFIPPFMQAHVDAAAKTFFQKKDGAIKEFCRKWIAVKECFRPIFATTEAESLSPVRGCNCNQKNTEQPSTVYFDKDYIGNVSSETILNTIEFLESFLPPPTKKTKRKNRVRGKMDEFDID